MIRRATPDDAERVQQLARDTFVETFGSLYSARDLSDYLEQAYAIDGIRRDIDGEGRAVWVLEHDGRVAGYASAGPCSLPHPDVTPGCGELKRLYLARDAQGGGRGTALLRATLRWLSERSTGRLWLGVFEENHGARRLYARHGFVEVGEYVFLVGSVRDRDLVLRRERLSTSELNSW